MSALDFRRFSNARISRPGGRLRFAGLPILFFPFLRAIFLAVTIGMAYGLSRRIWGSRFFLLLALTTLLFTPGIIANYLAVKQLGLLNSYASLILPILVNAFNLVVLRQFFMGIPQELLDSAAALSLASTTKDSRKLSGSSPGTISPALANPPSTGSSAGEFTASATR